ALASANALASRLETPDAPKRWDGVWPWVGHHKNTDGIIPHFSKDLRLIVQGQDHRVSDTPFDDLVGSCRAENQSSYHDGVIITITAGSGDEEVRVLEHIGQTVTSFKLLYF